MSWSIDGVQMPLPAYEGLNVAKTKMWSPNSGRTQLGDWVGTVATVKRTVKITLPVNISLADKKKIKQFMCDDKNVYHKVVYTNEFGETETINKAYLNDYETTVTYMTPDHKFVRAKKMEVHVIEV